MNKRALIVEDDVNIAELLMLYLEKDGFDVSIAHDGGRGIAMFNELNPDLVLLDIMMPVMDGIQVCREIRKVSMVPIIMLTAKRPPIRSPVLTPAQTTMSPSPLRSRSCLPESMP